MLWTEKKKDFKKKKTKERDGKDEGVIYKTEFKDCEKIYIGETKFKAQKRIGQRKKYVQYKRKTVRWSNIS